MFISYLFEQDECKICWDYWWTKIISLLVTNFLHAVGIERIGALNIMFFSEEANREGLGKRLHRDSA